MKNSTVDGAICCIGENKPDYFLKLKNLFISIDKLGGEISKLDRVVFFMGIPEVEYKTKLEQMGIKIINSMPVNPKYPHNNKVRMLELDLGYNWYILLDHDTIVCNDFLKLLNKMKFQAKPVDWSGPDMKFWEKIFRRFNLELPSNRYTTTSDAKEIIPYFNSGVLLVPGCYRKRLYDTWIYYIHELISIKERLNDYTFFIDQIALTLALQKTNIEVTPLPIEMNFHNHIPVNDKFCPPKIDPYIIHYHSCIDESGYLTSSKYPGVQKRIKEFNELLRQSKFENKRIIKLHLYSNSTMWGEKVKKIKTVVVLGMHRSGTSITTGILSKLGVNVGERLIHSNIANPLGYFEDIDFFELNKEILRSAGGGWKSPPERDAILIQENNYKKQIFDLVSKKESELWGWKDPRTNLTIDLYLPFLTNPYFIVCHREPMAVAKSLEQRENLEVEDGIRLIKIYEERINNFFQKFTDLQRLDINYEDIVTNSEKAIDELTKFLRIKVSTNQYQEALKMILTPKDIEKLRNEIKKQFKVNYTLSWGNE